MESLVAPDGGEAAASVGPYGAHAAPGRTVIPIGATDPYAKHLLLEKQIASFPVQLNPQLKLSRILAVTKVFFTAKHDLP